MHELFALLAAVKEFSPILQRMGGSCIGLAEAGVKITMPAEAEHVLEVLRGGNLTRLMRKSARLLARLSDEMDALAAQMAAVAQPPPEAPGEPEAHERFH
jgi:hypothetical protein